MKGPFRPKDKTLRVEHANALRLERAGLAAPYDMRSIPWDEHSPAIVGPATLTL